MKSAKVILTILVSLFLFTGCSSKETCDGTTLKREDHQLGVFTSKEEVKDHKQCGGKKNSGGPLENKDY